MSDLTCQSAAPRAYELLERGIDSRLHLGAQVYVSRRGAVVIDDAIGDAFPGRPLSPLHAIPWRSAGKPITAAAILKCCDDGRLALDQPVADVIPQYATGGKAHITLKQLLAHTVALAPALTEGFSTSHEPAPANWDDVISTICRTPLRAVWNVDTQAAYEPTRSWFILGEVLQITLSRPFDRIVRDDWFATLGMTNCSVNGPVASAAHQTAPLYIRTPHGIEPASVHNAPFPSPGASFHGPIRELAKFYEMLLRHGEAESEQDEPSHPPGQRLLAPATVADMTARHRIGRYDETFHHIIDFGIGVICDSNQYGRETVPYGFGRHCSPRTFGHGGAQTSIAFADPEHQLAVAVAFNTAPGEPQHQHRMREFLSQLYVDLGLS